MLELDVGIIILLIINIVYCWQLNKKVLVIKNSRNEIKNMINAFNNSINNAEESITKLKSACRNSTKDIHELMKKVEEVSNDLHFLIDSGESIANRLEGKISSVRKEQQDNVIPFALNNKKDIPSDKRVAIESILT